MFDFLQKAPVDFVTEKNFQSILHFRKSVMSLLSNKSNWAFLVKKGESVILLVIVKGCLHHCLQNLDCDSVLDVYQSPLQN